MNSFIEMSPEKFNESPFKIIGQDWMLVTAAKAGAVNTMTAAWGGLGVMWTKNVSFVVIRPQRYTKEFVDGSDCFSLSFLDSSYRKQLGYLGTASGRDEDKIAKAELTVAYDDGVPYFIEAGKVMICKKLYAQPYKPEFFIDTDLDSRFYPDSDHHTLYISEIIKLMVKE